VVFNRQTARAGVTPAKPGAVLASPARSILDALELSDRDEIRSGIEFMLTALFAFIVTPR
jgi:hypothetical protein